MVSSLQMYLYIYLMKFPALQKSIAHGSTMVGFLIGSLIAPVIAKRLDKKNTVLLGASVSIFGNLMLAILFLSGTVTATTTLSWGGVILPLASIAFITFDSTYWLGNGILNPIIFSSHKMKNLAELSALKSGLQLNSIKPTFAATLQFQKQMKTVRRW